MDEIWERAVETALDGQTDHLAARTLTLDGAVKCVQGRLPPPSIFEKFENLQHLSIANIGASSLEQFPRLHNLQKLILSDNRIAGGLEHLVEAGLDSLRDLDLSNNRIQFIEDLAPLARLRLVSLDLYECPVTRVKDYRVRVFGLIKSLKYLDKMDAEENERPESDDEEEDDDDEEEEDEEDDPGSGEIDGEEKPFGMNNGRREGEGIVDVDEEEESDADVEETEGAIQVHRPNQNGFRVTTLENGEDNEDSDEDEEGNESGEEIDEEDDGEDGDDVVEVHEIEDSDEEEDGVEDDDGEDDEDDDDDDDDEDDEEDDEEEEEVDNDEGDYGEPESTGRLASTEGEIDGHEQGEDDGEMGEEEEQGVEDDGEFEDEEEVRYYSIWASTNTFSLPF